MLNVRLAGGHLYGKQLFTWLLLVVSLMALFVLSFFPLDVLDEIWDVIESGSEGFLTYSYVQNDFVAALRQAVYLISSWIAFVFFSTYFNFRDRRLIYRFSKGAQCPTWCQSNIIFRQSQV